ncbi:MAG: hypothetical protein KDD47_21975 [Acidobacteria bacterium]|nr:hypothetical protein [Acidobacteriota bacterium]
MKTPDQDDPTRGGRPSLPPSALRRNRTLRFTDSEWGALKQRAGEAEQPLTDFLLAAGLSRPLPPRIPELNRRTFASMHQVGGNLNQLAHQLNLAALGGGVAPSTEQVATLLAELQEVFLQIRGELLGRASE